MSVNHEGHYEVRRPRALRRVKRKSLAPRRSTLEGKSVAQLWDFRRQGWIRARHVSGLALPHPSWRTATPGLVSQPS